MNPTGSGRFVPFGPSGSPFPSVRFFPFNGNTVTIAGLQHQIPDPGVDATYNDATINGVKHQTLAPNTTYYVYVYLDGIALALDFSITGWVSDLLSGVGIKLGDSSRSIVGMVRTDPDGRWRCDDKSQNTASFYNRVRIPVKCQVVSAETGPTGIGVWFEPNSNNRVSFVCWQDDIPGVSMSGSMTNDSFAGHVEASIGIDSNNTPGGSIAAWDAWSPNCSNGFCVRAGNDGGMSEGYHWFSVLMSVWNGTGRLRAGSSAAWDKTILQTEQVPS